MFHPSGFYHQLLSTSLFFADVVGSFVGTLRSDAVNPLFHMSFEAGEIMTIITPSREMALFFAQ